MTASMLPLLISLWACDDPVPGDIGGLIVTLQTTDACETPLGGCAPEDIARVVVHTNEVWVDHEEEGQVTVDTASRTIEFFNQEDEVFVAQYQVPAGDITGVRIIPERVVVTRHGGEESVFTGNPQIPSWTQSGWKWQTEDAIEIVSDELSGLRGTFSFERDVRAHPVHELHFQPTIPAGEFQPNPDAGSPGIYVDELTVVFEEGVEHEEVLAILETLGSGASVLYEPPIGTTWRIKLPVDFDAEKASLALSDLDEVAVVLPSVNYATTEIPADGESDNYVISRVHPVWDRDIRGSRLIRVAILDPTGLRLDHPDLALNYSLNEGEIPPRLLGAGCDPCLQDVDGDERYTFLDLNDSANWAHSGFGDCFDNLGSHPACDWNGNGVIDAMDLLDERHTGGLGIWENGVDDDDFDGDPVTFVDDLVGWNFQPDGPTPLPGNERNDNEPRVIDNDHGTNVAGIVGAMHADDPDGDGSLGIAGIAGRVQIMPLMALAIDAQPSNIPSTPHAQLSAALSYVMALNTDRGPDGVFNHRNDVHVVVIPVGWNFAAKNRRTCASAPSTGRGQTLEMKQSQYDERVPFVLSQWSESPLADLIRHERAPLLIFSAGNSGYDLTAASGAIAAPSALLREASPDNVIVTGNMDARVDDSTGEVHNIGLAESSNYGLPADVDLWAPGQGWISLGVGTDTVDRLNGTSFAAPVVAGAAVLLKSDEPDFSAADLKAQLVGEANFLAGRRDCGNSSQVLDQNVPYLNISRAIP